MSEDAGIRRGNLKRLCTARGWGARELSATAGGRYTYWADMLRGVKGFGERAARNLEEKAQLPRGWLDQIDAPLHVTREPSGSYVITRWPFSVELYEAVKAGGPDLHRRCENLLRALLELPPLQ